MISDLKKKKKKKFKARVEYQSTQSEASCRVSQRWAGKAGDALRRPIPID
jgi:hypothetical protein